MSEHEIHPELRTEYESGRAFERRFGDRGVNPEGRFAEPRSWVARAADEVKAWFGDHDALRRRQWDEAAGDHTGQGPTTDTDDDTRITNELSAALAADRRVDASDMRIAVQSGVVTLSGLARVSADRMFAEAAAWKIRGVVGVRNNLTVG